MKIAFNLAPFRTFFKLFDTPPPASPRDSEWVLLTPPYLQDANPEDIINNLRVAIGDRSGPLSVRVLAVSKGNYSTELSDYLRRCRIEGRAVCSIILPYGEGYPDLIAPRVQQSVGEVCAANRIYPDLWGCRLKGLDIQAIKPLPHIGHAGIRWL